MAGNINDFKSSFKTDLARPNRFDVSIPIPIVLTPYLNTARTLQYRCESTELPGRAFDTTVWKAGSNPNEKFPYSTSYNDISMTFIVSDDMSEKLFFDAWMEYIHPSSTYNVRYKSEYTASLKVNQYDVGGNLTYAINLVDAFPIIMNQMDLDWSLDGHHKLTIVFAYTNWQNNSIQALGSSLIQTGISTFLGQTPLINGPIGNLLNNVPGANILQGALGANAGLAIDKLSNFAEDYVSTNYFQPGQKDYVIDPTRPL